MTTDTTAVLTGDVMRRRALNYFFLFLICAPLSGLLFTCLPQIWLWIDPLEGVALLLASTALGLAMAVLPVAAVIGLIVAIGYGAESCFLPRLQINRITDTVLISLGLLLWFAPALALGAKAVWSLYQGSIHFSKPVGRDYLMSTDPIAFWQGIGFLLIVAIALAFPAWHYWKKRLAKTPPLHNPVSAESVI